MISLGANPGLNAPKLVAGSEWKRCQASWRHRVEITEVRGAQIFFRKQWTGKVEELPADLFLRHFRPVN